MARDQAMMRLTTPLTADVVAQLKAGDRIGISGPLYVARDAAHRRMLQALQAGEPLPFDPRGQIIYYMGPTPARPGNAIGSAGPTTSGRMDPYTLPLLEAGLKGMIGKGNRSMEVRQALQQYKAVYFAVTGGVAALVAKAIKEAEVIAYSDLGAEALRRLVVSDLPAVVVNDIYGADAYAEGKAKYRR